MNRFLKYLVLVPILSLSSCGIFRKGSSDKQITNVKENTEIVNKGSETDFHSTHDSETNTKEESTYQDNTVVNRRITKGTEEVIRVPLDKGSEITTEDGKKIRVVLDSLKNVLEVSITSPEVVEESIFYNVSGSRYKDLQVLKSGSTDLFIKDTVSIETRELTDKSKHTSKSYSPKGLIFIVIGIFIGAYFIYRNK